MISEANESWMRSRLGVLMRSGVTALTVAQSTLRIGSDIYIYYIHPERGLPFSIRKGSRAALEGAPRE